jgi:hypothetical protein
MNLVSKSIALWGPHSGGGGGIAEAPRSVITIEWNTIYGTVYEKIRG